MTKITYIPGEIANAAIDEHGNRKPVTRTQHIFDDALGKPQSEVNQDRIEDVATLDGKIGTEKTRAEGVESDLNNRLGTVEQLAEISIGGGDAQIATGADFTNPDATKRAKIPTVGAIVDGLNDGIYDVSKRNPTGGPNSDGKFTLEYILSNADTLIPTGWRHGGMIISFVHSSDNKYVQFRCMAQNFTTDVTKWQGEDIEPQKDSRNLVESGGVADKTLMVSTHSSAHGSGNYTDVYQNDKLFSVYCSLNHEYEGYTIRIIQLGWLESQKYFYFHAYLYKDGNYQNLNCGKLRDLYGGTRISYASIPLINKRYVFDIYLGSNKIGLISFNYDWEKINGNTDNHLLNPTTDNFDAYHIEITDIYYDYNHKFDNVYDISLNFPTSGVSGGNTFTLSSAVSIVPTVYQKGGLAIKFIDSETNNYVKYHLPIDSWTTDIEKWVKDDFEKEALGIKTHLNIILSDIYGSSKCPYVGILKSDNTISFNNSCRVSDLIKIERRYIYAYNIYPKTSGATCGLLLFNANKEVIANIGDDTNTDTAQTTFLDVETEYPSAVYVRFCVYNNKNSFVCLTDDKDYPLKQTEHIVSSHAYYLNYCRQNSVYQNDKLGFVECHLKEDYEGCSLLIYQLGWSNSAKKFYCDAALRSSAGVITNVTLSKKSISYASIPLEDKLYSYELLIGDVIIGTLTFKYKWSLIAGNTAYNLLNIDVANLGYGGSIIVNPVFYDYVETLTFDKLAEGGIIIRGIKGYGYGQEREYTGTYNPSREGVITIKDSAVSEDCLLLSLKTDVKNAGKFKIGIGHMDQRGWYLEIASFDVETENTGFVTWDLTDRQIIIPKGEQIFIHCACYDNEGVGFSAATATPPDPGFYFGPADGVLEYYPNGGYCTIYCETREVKTPFATKEGLEKTDEELSSVSNIANTALSNSFKVKDRAGNTYKLMVVNGSLQIISMQFSNVLVIGNSLCIHAQTQEYGGWYASGRGMASTVVGNDYCGILQTALRETIPNAQVTRYNNLVSWFRNPTDLSDAKFDELFGDILENAYDLVVFRLSENNNDHIDLMKNAIIACINYIWEQIPNTEVIITSDVMSYNSAKNAQLSAAALELGVTYVDADCSNWRYKYQKQNGNYVPYFYTGDDSVLYPIQSMFSSHINDVGMQKVANAILHGVGYDTIELSYHVQVNTELDYDSWAEGVVNGVHTILLYSENAPTSYSVKDADNNTIQAVLHDMSSVTYYTSPSRIPTYAITFTMPDSNVTVNIE